MASDHNQLLGAALHYASIGWRVFPCRPGTKAPQIQNGCRGATTDPELITTWWTRWPTANVAVACGDGLFVIDIDVEDAKNGWESLKEFPALPDTVRQDTPRGGAHFIYTSDRPPRNKNNFRPGIDIRSDGYYIMVPPSVHPNGKTYAWADGHAPGMIIALAEYPDFMRPPEQEPLPWDNVKPITAQPTKPSSGTVSHDVLDRAREYLAECDAAVQGANGHDKLLWAARAMVVGFELDEGTATSLLWSDYNPRCVPPWDSSKPGERKDFERKVKEALRTPGERPRGWLLQEYALAPNEAEMAYGQQLRADLLAASEKSEPEPAPVAEESTGEELILSRPRFNPPPNQWPDWILDPPGLVGQFCQYINQTAGCYQPLLTLGASLTACGALMGRKVRDQSNGRTNLYMMGVAHSSTGKDHPGKQVKGVLKLAGVEHLLGGSRVTSDSAIEAALEACPVQLYHWDEIGHMFAAIKQAGVGSGGAQHLRTIVPALMELYSSAGDLYLGKQRASEEMRRIDQPHVCVWGLTSPDVLYSGLSTAELRDGWLGRVITLISHDRPKYIIKQSVPPPDNLIQLTQAWVQRVIPPPPGVGDIFGATTCHQITVPTSATALKVFESCRDECYDRMIKCDKDNDPTQYLWGKALQNARRIALIIAAGCAFDGAEIQEFHAKYSCELIRLAIEGFRESIKNNMSDNSWEGDKQNILSIIATGGRAGIGKAELTRKTQWCKDRKIRDAYIEDMQEAGIIVVGRHPGKGLRQWLWKAPYGYEIIGGSKEDE